MEKKLFGKRMQAARQQAKLSQEELAEKTGLTSIYISMIERGVRTPSLDTFVNIANSLDVSADILLMDDLRNGYQIQASKLSESLEHMEPEDRQRVFLVIEALINAQKK